MEIESAWHPRFGLATDDPLGMVELMSTCVYRHHVQHHRVLPVRIQTTQPQFHDWKHPPATLGDDHLSSDLVEHAPQSGILKSDFDLRVGFVWGERR